MSAEKISTNRLKILNDPIYGFIHFPHEIVHNLIEHPYFQRLRRIKQLGLTHLVYPGALHTRFHHALGAMHLMTQAIDTLRFKGSEITEEEAMGSVIAILLHDIGHGPYSHALESTIVEGVNHEDISSLFMDRLNRELNGALNTALDIFNNRYPKHFLHQMVSSQLDMDRLDYLRRDSFYSGVSEGIVSSDRIIKMLNVAHDELVVEEKGIYSIEKFIVARRLMYWQVYLHKTVVGAEFLLVNILKRAKELALQGQALHCSPALQFFLYEKRSKQDFIDDEATLDRFAQLDDYDIMGAIKVWSEHEDHILKMLCQHLIHRKLFKIKVQNTPFEANQVDRIRALIAEKYEMKASETPHFIIQGKMVNNAYNPEKDHINILMKSGNVLDIAQASDNLNISSLSNPVEKHFLSYPKEMET